jgi:hypothetical protein
VKINFDIQMIHNDTPFRLWKDEIGFYYIAFAPYPKEVKSKASWPGLGMNDEMVALSLSSYFKQMAKQMKKDREKKKTPPTKTGEGEKE